MPRQFYDGYAKEYCLQKDNCSLEKNDCCEKDKTTVSKECLQNHNKNSSHNQNGLNDIFEKLAVDDIILIGIVLLLLHDGTNDTLLLIILGIVFFSGIT